VTDAPLDLSRLPDLPQSLLLRQVAADLISRVGRRLSGRLSFDCPDEAEVTVRRCWPDFTAS
jgi:hypothetical protein